ncbi:SURF1 family protein [Nocardioides sp.]|uniref:SURF1 family protein n=1 Tax=Nocardioides sp. TaxID=35761 RepID=UPI003D11F648
MPVPRPLQPRYWGYHLLAVVLVATAIGLGLWQYDAWQTRRSAEATDLTQRDPIPLADAIGPDDPFPGNLVGQPVTVTGTWVPQGTVYVSGREHEGRDGFWMVTPLQVDGGDSALEIVLGWTASLQDAPAAPDGAGEVVAWLQPPEGTGEADPDPADDVLPQLRIADAIQHVDQDLYGAYAVQLGEYAGLVQADLEQLPDAGRFTALRNLLYALEWWVFGGFAVFIWWRWVRDEVLVRDEAVVGD